MNRGEINWEFIGEKLKKSKKKIVRNTKKYGGKKIDRISLSTFTFR